MAVFCLLAFGRRSVHNHSQLAIAVKNRNRKSSLATIDDHNADSSSTVASPGGLVRALGPWIATAVVVGNVIGSGIFLKPGNIAGESGHFGVIIAVWVFGGLLCILGGLCFAELAAMYPKAGGLYVYLREAYGKPVAFLFGWTEVFFGKPASIGALAVAFVGSLSLALGGILTPSTQILLAISLIVIMAWINVLGVLLGGRLQLIVTIVKAVFLALVAIVPFILIPFVSGTIDVSNYSTTVAPETTGLAAQIGVVLLAVMWAYNGWHGITPLAEEVRDPHRNIPRALFVGIGILIVLYLAANFAYHGVLSMSEMKTAGDHAAEKMLKKLFGQGGLAAMSAVIMCSTFGAINTNLLQAPRVTFAMGRDKVFFRSLGRVHATFRTPAFAIIVMAVMSIGLVLAVGGAQQFVMTEKPDAVDDTYSTDKDKPVTGDVLANDWGRSTLSIESFAQPSSGEVSLEKNGTFTYRPQSDFHDIAMFDYELVDVEGNTASATVTIYVGTAAMNKEKLLPVVIASLRNDSIFGLLTNFVIFSASIFYMLGVLAVIILRFRQPNRTRPYRTWGYPVVPIAFLTVYVWFMMQIYQNQELESRTGLFLIALGVPVFLAYRYRERRREMGDTPDS
jgi:amino acid transporter